MNLWCLWLYIDEREEMVICGFSKRETGAVSAPVGLHSSFRESLASVSREFELKLLVRIKLIWIMYCVVLLLNFHVTFLFCPFSCQCYKLQISSIADRNVRRILVRGHCPLAAWGEIFFWKFDYEMVHCGVYLNIYVVSIAPFSTPACPDCSQNIT